MPKSIIINIFCFRDDMNERIFLLLSSLVEDFLRHRATSNERRERSFESKARWTLKSAVKAKRLWQMRDYVITAKPLQGPRHQGRSCKRYWPAGRTTDERELRTENSSWEAKLENREYQIKRIVI